MMPMTPQERIDDCNSIRDELVGVRMPWFCTTDRLNQTAHTYHAGLFGRFVHETRRVGNGRGLWLIIEEKLEEWEPLLTH
jgi:hypothetical protein